MLCMFMATLCLTGQSRQIECSVEKKGLQKKNRLLDYFAPIRITEFQTRNNLKRRFRERVSLIINKLSSQ